MQLILASGLFSFILPYGNHASGVATMIDPLPPIDLSIREVALLTLIAFCIGVSLTVSFLAT